MLNRAFTAQHVLQDAEQEYADAIYKFRQAERDKTSDYGAARCAMNKAEQKVASIRQRIYCGNTHKIWEKQVPYQQTDCCPVPDWI